MAKKGKSKSAKFEIEENESGPLDSKPLVVLSSSDDEEANEDLSLKIVEKALSGKAVRFDDGNHGVVSVVDLASSSSRWGSDVAGTIGGGEETDLDLKSKKTVKKKKKKTKIEKTDLDLKSKKTVKKKKKKTKIEKVTIKEDGDRAEMLDKVDTVEEAIMGKAAGTVESLDPNTVDKSVNIVLRKLLRGARYFDPPDSSWESCYNCGEEGHMAVNCKSASKRKKPCFLCGSLDHAVRQCSKAQDCFICKKTGHRAKDCPDKHNSALKHCKICLRCGGSGHDMFSCKNEYSHDDIKEIQCYICKSFGHLCCVNVVDTTASDVSCYRCGQLGHTGLSCGRSRGETKETTDNGSPSLCYKCGEGGHFERECTTGTPSSSLCYKCGEGGHFARECSYAKVGKRNREPSTPNVRPRRENIKFSGYKSAPHDHGKTHKRKKIKFEENGYSTPRKEKQRGGWITEDPGDFSNRKSTRGHSNYPSTLYTEGRKKSSSTSGGHISGSFQSLNKRNLIDIRHQGLAVSAMMNQGGFHNWW